MRDVADSVLDNHGLPELQNEAKPTDWRLLLRSFNNVKILFVANSAVNKLSCSLQLDPPNNLLSELEELAYSPSNDNANTFNGFIDTCQNAGYLITLVHLKDTISTSF